VTAPSPSEERSAVRDYCDDEQVDIDRGAIRQLPAGVALAASTETTLVGQAVERLKPDLTAGS
jgi:hypothetical protein